VIKEPGSAVPEPWLVRARLVARLADTLPRHPLKEPGHVPEILLHTRGDDASGQVLTTILERNWARSKASNRQTILQ
jgi:hypothetical protein